MKLTPSLLAVAIGACLFTAQAAELRPLDPNALRVLGVTPAAPAQAPAPVPPSGAQRLVPMQVQAAPARPTPVASQPTRLVPMQFPRSDSTTRVQPSLPATAVAPAPPQPAPAAPAALTFAPEPPPAPRKTFEVKAGDMASDVFRRWLDAEGLQLVWETSRDFRLEAGARFHEPGALDAVRSVAEVLGRTHPDFVVRAFANGVVVVMDKS